VTASKIATSWKVLRAGEVLSVRESGHAMLAYDDLQAGTYDFSATYEPPYITPDVHEAVRGMRVDILDRRLTSNGLTFVKGK
jgi:hypothetical protein